MIGNAAGTFEITREEIANLRYLRNPRTAALYLGIPQVQVEDVWAELPQPRKNHSGYTYRRESSGLNELNTHQSNAIQGSRNLRHAYSMFFAKWEKENGFKEGAGEILVPAGFQP